MKRQGGYLVETDGKVLDASEFVSANQALIQSLPLFAGIPFGLIEPFLCQCEYRRYADKSILISPDQANHYLYVLLSGQLTVQIESLESGNGINLQAGELVGEISIIDGKAPTAFVVTSGACLLLCIHDSLLWSELIKIQGAAKNILRLIAERMRARCDLIQQSVEQSLRLEHLEKELSIAQELQISMLPLEPFFPNHLEVEVDALMKAAKAVGGDFYDCFPLDSDRICIAIGDVAGKGIPAALFMVRTVTLLRAEMLKCKDLLQTICAINENLSQDNPSCMFVTMMICIIDLSEGRLHYVNGGHNQPLFGDFQDGFQFIDQPKGILVGINPYADYQILTRQLNAGDMMVLYTDGITEAMNSTHIEFSEQRLLAYINKQGEQTVRELIAGIKMEVKAFVGSAEQSDDITLLIFRFLGCKKQKSIPRAFHQVRH